MGCLPILITRPFVDQLVKIVVAHFATALGWPNARLLYRLSNHLCGWSIMCSLRVGVEAIALASLDHRKDAWSRWLIAFGGPVAQTDMVAGGSLQFTVQVGSRTKHNRFDERYLPFAFAGFLSLQQGSQFLRFGVGELVRIIDGRQLAIVFPSPGSGITAKSSRLTLDFDEEETLWCEDEEIDFIDAAVVCDEFEIAPGPVRFMRRELGSHEFESFPFPRKARFCDRHPVLRCCHLESRSRWSCEVAIPNGVRILRSSVKR